MYFEQIDQPSDVKRLKLNQLETLAAEMRQALLQKAEQARRPFRAQFRHGGGDDRLTLCVRFA